MNRLKYYLPGTLMIMMGILILAVPEILVLFVAASVVMIGVSLLYLGHSARRSDSEGDGFRRSTSYVRFSRDPLGDPFSWRN